MRYCPKYSLILDSKTALEILQAEEQAEKEPEHLPIQPLRDVFQRSMKALQKGLAESVPESSLTVLFELFGAQKQFLLVIEFHVL